jgi:ribonuclease D
MSRAAPVVIATQSAFEEMIDRLLEGPIVAVDSESDSLYSYYEKVCLIQFSIPETDYVLDTLAVRELERLGSLFADLRVEKVFHAAEYDIMVMKRDFHFEFANIFDSMVAARILGWKHVGLGSILEDRFGVRLDKRFQRADWGKRPLTPELIAYARDDTHHLIALRAIQKAELERLGRLDEAHEEFARLTRVMWSEREFDPNRYWTFEGARELDPVGLGILRELYQFREHHAEQEDRPPFKVISESTLVQLSRSRPRTLKDLAAVGGVGDWLVRRYGRGILEMIEKGFAAPQRSAPRVAGRNFQRMPDNATRQRYARLKEWRRDRAQARGVEADVVVSNDVLLTLARKNPKTRDALLQVSGLGTWKAQEYGEEILRVLLAANAAGDGGTPGGEYE